MKEKLKQYFLDVWKTKNKRITALTYVIAPFVCALVIDFFNKRSIIGAFKGFIDSPYTYFINVMIICFTMSLGLLCKRRLSFASMILALWLGLGVANFVIMSMRTSPFSATDLKLLGQIDNIIEVYLTPFTLILIIVAIMIVVVGVSILWVKLPKYAEKISYVKNLFIIGIVFLVTLLTVNLGLMTDKISEKFPNMTIAYYNYGFPYCFSTSLFNTGVSQPDEYTEDKVMDILNKMKSTSVINKAELKTPNIIFLQLESFFDISKMEDIELSTDATPIFNGLKEEYPSGYLTVNNVGYGTANTEFEVMTGLNLDDFGPGEFPYNTILSKSTCESTAYILKEYGYTAHALHNNTATFYSRNSVFRRLGFDTFTSIEYMYPTEYTPTEWCKDMVLVEEIMKALESTEDTDYIYTISVKGHGAYPTEQVIEKPMVEVVSGMDNESRRCMIEYYANMIYEMDTFIGKLIERLSKYGEDTVLVIYGDHLPSLDITENELENGDLYQTEYVVWNNINLEMDDKDIETFQLSSRVLEHLNIETGYINKFHQIFGDRADYFSKLHVLSYDILYGNMFAYGGINPYVATDMKMGTYDVVIKSVNNATNGDLETYFPELKEEEQDNMFEDDTTSVLNPDGELGQTVTEPIELLDGCYIIKGDNFTEYSTVYINGKQYETKYIDKETLFIQNVEVQSLDVFVVKQKSGATTLSSSHEFTYFYIGEDDSDDLEISDDEDDINNINP